MKARRRRSGDGCGDVRRIVSAMKAAHVTSCLTVEKIFAKTVEKILLIQICKRVEKILKAKHKESAKILEYRTRYLISFFSFKWRLFE